MPTAEPADEGEIALPLTALESGGHRRSVSWSATSTTSRAAAARCRAATTDTGDVAQRDADGYITYVGRADDVFKSSDYRISPFEIESALIEHALVAEAAVVPSPDAMRLSVPKAFCVLRGDATPIARGGARDLPLRARAPAGVQAR